MRINKYIASLTKYSRRQADQLILAGRVKVNDRILDKTDLGLKINPEQDKVYLDQQELKSKKRKLIYLAFNKPKGFITSRRRQHGQRIIFDLLPKNLDVYPIGRLDKNSHGLLILTNDGDLTQQLTHPQYQHEKEYIVKTKREITNKQLDQLRQGIKLEAGLAKAKKIVKINQYELDIVLTTGFKRQIREMLLAVSNKVVDLKRIRINKLRLDNLPSGKWRYISKKDII